MASQFTIDNAGLGWEPGLTLGVDTTSAKDFSQTDLDSNLTAGRISGNNIIGMGSSGDKLFGKVLAVSTDKTAGGIPLSCTVQARGVARFKYNTGGAPAVNQMVELDGAGKVQVATADADIAAGGHLARGMVIAKDTTNETVDVWLG